ncbi:hypothetical protein RJ641_030472 [Dillenia turbinata]|uniref:C2H2-type domain-containing protein n=1 Tax=Dillenia turbinata TaxID=194707 RepID=A0AAN8W3A0_9MAGN
MSVSGDDGSFSSGNTGEEVQQLQEQQQQHASNSTASNSNGFSSHQQQQHQPPQQQPPLLHGVVKLVEIFYHDDDPTAEVIALSPTTLMATNRFVCEICSKGFQRDQNLQLHRRGHNLPWKLRQRTSTEIRKRVYICPEPSCVHHNPARALGDLTGIKKHYSRKHGEKKWKCDKCSKKYAVQSDWKAHSKTCGTREYKCDCGTIFSRRDSFITHRAFCDALAEENNKVNQGLANSLGSNLQNQIPELMSAMPITNTNHITTDFNNFDSKLNPLKSLPQDLVPMPFKTMSIGGNGSMFSSSSGSLFGGPKSNLSSTSSSLQLSPNTSGGFNNYLHDSKNGSNPFPSSSAPMSATALLQKAAQIGATASNSINSPMMQKIGAGVPLAGPEQISNIRPTTTTTYAGIQQPNSSFDHYQPQIDNPMITPSQLLHRSPHEISQFFDANSGTMSMTEMGVFNGLFMGGDQNHGFNLEHEDTNTGSNNAATASMMQGRNVPNTGLVVAQGMVRNPMEGSRFEVGRGGGPAGGSVTTLDLLGMGGSRPSNLRDQQQQRLELEAINQQRMQVMNPFHQQLSHGDSAMEKSIWDV